MKKKLLLITLIILLVIIELTSIVSASSFTATMTASNTTVPESTELTVTIKVSNIDAGDKGINSISGILSYDNAVFETLTTASIDSLNEWVATYSPDSGKFTLYKNTWVKNDEEVAQITLKTKKGSTGKTGEITCTSIEAANSESQITASDISTRITVGTPSSSGDTGNTSTNTNSPQQIPTNTSRNNTANNTNRNTNVANNTNTNTNKAANNAQSSYVNTNGNTTSEDDIPYTGTSDNIMRAIFVVLVIAGISYFKYESIKEN